MPEVPSAPGRSASGTTGGCDQDSAAGAGAVAEFGLRFPAWNAGVAFGSVVNVMFTAPCGYGK